MSGTRTHRVVALQTRPLFGDVEANLTAVDRPMADLRADLIVLPELFASGYAFRDRDELSRLAEDPEGGKGATLERLCIWSTITGSLIVAGFPERSGERFYNSAAVVADGDLLAVYRKVHLFGFEPELFDEGDGGFPVLERAGLRVGVMICIDWIYPEAARSLALDGADVIAHPSNLILPWCQRAMPVRALENGVYTVTANRVGTEHRPPRPRLAFTGRSQIASPLGEVLAEAGQQDLAMLAVDVDTALSRNKVLPSGNDRLAERRPSHYRRLLES